MLVRWNRIFSFTLLQNGTGNHVCVYKTRFLKSPVIKDSLAQLL